MNVTACIPSVRGDRAPETVAACIKSVCDQTVYPMRVIVADSSKHGIDPGGRLGRLCGLLKVEIHRMAPNIPKLRAVEHLASYANTEWMWLVDDDAWPMCSALEWMVHTQETSGAPLVGSTRLDVAVPEKEPPDAGFQNWSRGINLFDREAVTLDGISLLVRTSWVRQMDLSFQPKGEGGDDVHFTSQIQGGVVSSGSKVLHMQSGSSSSSGWPPGPQWYKENILPLIGDEAYDKLEMAMRHNFLEGQ